MSSAKQIILTLREDGNVDGFFGEDLSDRDVAWMLKCAEVELLEIMADNHSSLTIQVLTRKSEDET